MKVVCDTNILVSGILFGGNAREILRLVARGRLVIVISAEILRETEDVLNRPKFGLSPEQVIGIVALFRDTFDTVSPGRRITAIKADPVDNRVLEAAEAAKAAFIVSGDKHLLQLGSWRDIPILSPARFVAELAENP